MERSAPAPTATTCVADFLEVRRHTEELATVLSGEDQTVQSMADTSPTKWHRAHITWFFETFLLEPFEADFAPYDPDYSYLFNSYYEQVGDRYPRPERGLISRPSAAEVGGYRTNIERRIVELVDEADADTLARILPLITLGIHHEQQHQELLLMDIKHVLSVNPAEPSYADEPHVEADDPGRLGWVSFEGGVVPIGRDESEPGFSFDNEGPRHEALLHPYRLADRLITCSEWLDFMADDGYHRPELWLSDGWHRRVAEEWDAPLYWRASEYGWRIHTLSGSRPLDKHEPVCHVSFYEADAYATWAEKRLATEFEWEHASSGRPVEGNFQSLHPCGAGPSTGDLRQLFGDCWEWTESSYRPYPGFRPVGGAIGEYNGKFMINTMVQRGGCAFTPNGHTRNTYRNFFAPHTRWHLSGVRLADEG